MQKNNISSLTGLRGIAAWWVVIYHFRETLGRQAGDLFHGAIFAHGYLAVDMFFILSGFVICYNYSSLFANFRLNVVYAFYAKRIARIYPLHIFLLLVFLINPLAIYLFSASGELGERYDLSYFMLSIFLVQNWGFTQSLAWNVPAWSISTEFAAYLIFPPLIFVLKRFSAPCLILFYAFFLGVLFSIFHLQGFQSLGVDIAGYGLYRCLLQFSMGVVLALLWIQFERVKRLISWMSLLIGFVLVFFQSQFGVLSNLLFVPILFSCVILYLLNERSLGAKVLSLEFFVFLGEISYSTYLVHYFIKDWVKFFSDDLGFIQFFIYIFLVLLSSVFLNKYIEVPFRERALIFSVARK